MIDISKFSNLRNQVGLAIPCSGTLAAISASRRTEETKTSVVAFPPRHADHRHIDLIAASLAGGMIAATGREHSADEVVQAWREVRRTLALAPVRDEKPE